MMQWGIQRSLSKTDFGNNYQKKKKKMPQKLHNVSPLSFSNPISRNYPENAPLQLRNVCSKLFTEHCKNEIPKSIQMPTNRALSE